MTYTHLTTDELVMLEAYYHQNAPVTRIAERLNRSRQPIYNVIYFLKSGHTALDFYKQYKKNKKCCGRRKITLSKKQQGYIQDKVTQGWAPDVIIGREEMAIDCSMRTLYRRFKECVFDEATLPMKGKRKPNGHQERRGKQAFKRHISERESDYPFFKKEFGHIEGDTIDCEKEFSNWKSLCNHHDVSIYFADPGTPSQRALNENSNGLLRKDGLAKEMDFNQVDQAFISSVADKRNNIPRKSLDYRTPLEAFWSHLNEAELSSLY